MSNTTEVLNKRKVSVTKKFSFEASHNLTNYAGLCSRLHGHSYKLFVTISGYIYPESQNVYDCMVMDFKELKHLVDAEVVNKLDHFYLNDIYPQPTAEVMAIDIYERISNALPTDCTLEKVRLYETEDSYAEVCRD